MENPILYVAVAERDSRGREICYFCGESVRPTFPANLPQVCHQCAARDVWHKCNGCPRTPKAEQAIAGLEAEVKRVRGRMRRKDGYWKLIDGVGTFDVRQMGDDMRTLLAALTTKSSVPDAKT